VVPLSAVPAALQRVVLDWRNVRAADLLFSRRNTAVLAFVMFLISPENMRVLWHDPLGIKMIALAIFLQITGAMIIRRLVQIEY